VAALVAIRRLAVVAEIDISTLGAEPVSTSVAPSATTLNTNDFLAVFAVHHGLAVRAENLFAHFAPCGHAAVQAKHLVAHLAPSSDSTVKTKILVANFTPPTQAAVMAKHLVAHLAPSRDPTVEAKALVAHLAISRAAATVAKRLVATITKLRDLAVIAKDLVALIALRAAITAKIVIAHSASLTRPAVVARRIGAHCTQLVFTALLLPLFDRRRGVALHRGAQNVAHNNVIESAWAVRVHVVGGGAELNLSQGRRPRDRRESRPSDSGAVHERQLRRSGARGTLCQQSAQRRISQSWSVRTRELDLTPQLWCAVHCHAKSLARCGESNPVLNGEPPSNHSHKLARQVRERRHLGAVSASLAAARCLLVDSRDARAVVGRIGGFGALIVACAAAACWCLLVDGRDARVGLGLVGVLGSLHHLLDRCEGTEGVVHQQLCTVIHQGVLGGSCKN
jgi:hypothetical protein